jgi:hypothetical protein
MGDNSVLNDIPDVDTIRKRLAVLVTEASLLRAQLRVSKRIQQEQERLRRQGLDDKPVAPGGAA